MGLVRSHFLLKGMNALCFDSQLYIRKKWDSALHSFA